MLRLSVSCDSLDLVWSLTECKGEAKGTRSTVLALTEDLKHGVGEPLNLKWQAPLAILFERTDDLARLINFWRTTLT